jgi:superfamily II DNA or RNA helicase
MKCEVGMKRIYPRSYQKRAVTDAINLRKKVLVVSPGGSGKTVMIALLASRMLDKHKKVLIVAHRREIINQCFNHLLALGVDAKKVGVLMGQDDREDPKAPIQLANIAMFKFKPYPMTDVLIVDEAHHAVAVTYNEMIAHYDRARLFGFTATPYRLDGRGLGDVYDVLIEAIKPSELIKNNWLALPRIITASKEFLPNLDKLRIHAGDFSPSALEKRVAKTPLVGNVIEHWQKHANDRTTLVFAVTINHSKAIVSRFKAAGVEAAHIEAKTPVDERQETLDGLASGRIKVVSSCMILSEGFDLPHCDAVVLARPTLSLALAQQQANRGMRYNNGIRPIILDHARHYLMFGLPYADREYELSETQDVARTRMLARACPICGLVLPLGEAECECGYEFPARERGDPEELEEQLDELTMHTFASFKKRLVDYAKKEGMPKSWVEIVSRQWLAHRA